MKTLRRLIYGEVLAAVGFVTLGFLALFFFFDFVDELQGIGKNNGAYQLKHAMSYVLLLVPSHLYELLPISVLIGTIFVMARLAQSSEFTILRTSGLGPTLALRTAPMSNAAYQRVGNSRPATGAKIKASSFEARHYCLTFADLSGE